MKQIESELADVYGPVPDEVKLMLELAGIRIEANKWDIKSIVASGQDLVFSFAKELEGKTKDLFANVSGKVRIPSPMTVYLRLPANYFEPKTLINVLHKIFSVVL